MTPISLATTFAQEGVGGHRGFEYSRSGNPTRAALEACLASLESARHGLAYASGLAAEDSVLRLVPSGGRVVLGNDAYGGTFRLIDKVWGPYGLQWTAVDLTDVDALRSGWPDGTAMVWLETPTNPLAVVHRHRRGVRRGPRPRRAGRRRQHVRHAVPAAADRARRRHRRALGDEVPRRAQRCRRRLPGGQRRRRGRSPALHPERRRRRAGPVRLLPRAARREDARCADGSSLCERAGGGRAVAAPPAGRVASCTRSSPTTPVMPPRRSRCATSAGWSASACAAESSRPSASPPARELFTLAESLGAVESLIEHPGEMTHASVADSPLEVPDDLLRLSVGIESATDLVADLEQALDRA